MGMKLEALIKTLDVTAVRGSTDVDIAGIAYDSRQVRENYLFVALSGQAWDGATFIDEARQRGAIAVVVSGPETRRRDMCHIHVADCRRALAQLAVAFYRDPSRSLRVVGVTGTNGKTSTTFMTRAILTAANLRPGLLGTVEYIIGDRAIPASRTTPESLDLQAMLDQMVQSGCRSVAMEVSSHALMQNRVDGVAFDVCVFTNLTRDHLDYHQTMEAYFEAKCRLFQTLGKQGKPATAVINLDDSYGRELVRMLAPHDHMVTIGTDPRAMVRAEDVSLTREGSAFRIVTPWGSAPVKLGLLGRFNVANALAALASCGALGIDLSLMVKALGQMEPVPGRLESIPTGRGFQVFIDYAHTDDALKNVLETLREITIGRMIVVFGCGGNRDRSKRPLMGAVAAERADYAILTSDNPRKEPPLAIIDEIRGGMGDWKNYEIIEDRAAAIERAMLIARPDDVILVAGKGHERTQEFANTIVPFDDHAVVRTLLR